MTETATTTAPDDLRPVVRTAPQGNYGLWAFLAILLIGGLWLFSALTDAREAAQAPAVFATEGEAGRIASPPPLVLPESGRVLPLDLGEDASPAPLPPPPAGPPAFLSAPPSAPPPRPAMAEQPYEMPPFPSSPDLPPSAVFERSNNAADALSDAAPPGTMRATRLANPSTTVPQGTIIPAVLETAFDSTRPGRVRALVQRDVHGFDGSRVLIPRGSRLFGEYEAGLNPGARRAMITWTRLLRPDGVSIALDSPASDPLGRGGVEGDVNSRFFARFGSALLQSVLDIGVGVAAGEATGGRGTVLALPGSTQNITNNGAQQPRPVLEIDHGTSVTVYVARDLDFTGVER